MEAVYTLSWSSLQSDETYIFLGCIVRRLKPWDFWKTCQYGELKERPQHQQTSHSPKDFAKLENGCHFLILRKQNTANYLSLALFLP